jgi:hypothetical protein
MSGWWKALVAAAVLLVAVRVLVPTIQMHFGFQAGEWWDTSIRTQRIPATLRQGMLHFQIRFDPGSLSLRYRCAVWTAPLETAWWGPSDMSVGPFAQVSQGGCTDPVDQAAANRWFSLLGTMTGWTTFNAEAMKLRGSGCMTEEDRESGQCEIVFLDRY